MEQTKITIITICYNSEQTIEKTIKSVLEQNYENLEYIIVDGASEDNTMSIVNRYKCSCMTVLSEKDDGISDAFNKGISMASGEIIGLINSDDQLYRGVLRRIDRVYRESLADVIYGDTLVIDETNDLQFVKKAEELSKFKYEMPFIHQSCFIKREAYKKYGTYSQAYKICMDYDMLARLYHNKAHFAYAQEIISIFYYGGYSCQSPVKTVHENMQIAKAYGLNQCSLLIFKAKKIFTAYLKIILSQVGLWRYLYLMLKGKNVRRKI